MRAKMKFFVPDCSSDSEMEALYARRKDFLLENGFHVKSTRVFRVRFSHKGTQYEARVGEELEGYGGRVMAIFASTSGAYVICTSIRGWDMDTMPILTGPEGDDAILEVELFGDH